ncbi:hypothetical protein GXY_16157 [Novacetimonas hansenii ATCC 23769]|uniref:Uncharacterized protein n=1 Tax=Novacetimonas hansenii ATCC 23769 TaxID=714995 RepID=D5QJ98_NOVHA|nr:hypothetical protein GXY_16157 [Novacetimonas hansenii ATCC 23769]
MVMPGPGAPRFTGHRGNPAMRPAGYFRRWSA